MLLVILRHNFAGNECHSLVHGGSMITCLYVYVLLITCKWILELTTSVLFQRSVVHNFFSARLEPVSWSVMCVMDSMTAKVVRMSLRVNVVCMLF